MNKQPIQRFQTEPVLKILGDPIRAAILRMLLVKPATLSQMGEVFQKHPAQIRHHIKQLEKIGVVELESVQNVKNYQEKYYQATAKAFFINISFFPDPPPEGQFVILGSDDYVLNLLAETINNLHGFPHLLTLPVGSLNGLIYLRENYCQITGCHLLDMQSGQYNIDLVRNLFSDKTMKLVTLSHRCQGLLVKKGNPKNIQSLFDLGRKDVVFINRNRGAGTRLWLENALPQQNIDSSKITYGQTEALTHSEVANLIEQGLGDTGLAISSAANFADLDFIPLFEERYDLVMSEEIFNSEGFQKILTIIRSPTFHQQVAIFEGYNTRNMGKVIHV